MKYHTTVIYDPKEKPNENVEMVIASNYNDFDFIFYRSNNDLDDYWEKSNSYKKYKWEDLGILFAIEEWFGVEPVDLALYLNIDDDSYPYSDVDSYFNSDDYQYIDYYKDDSEIDEMDEMDKDYGDNIFLDFVNDFVDDIDSIEEDGDYIIIKIKKTTDSTLDK